MRSPETKLEEHVAARLKEIAQDWQCSIETAYGDLMRGGCQSGMVGHLIYYTDTVEFYEWYQLEIDAYLAELCNDTGLSPATLFEDKWDNADPLAREKYNQNLLAWFGFEETACRLMEEY